MPTDPSLVAVKFSGERDVHQRLSDGLPDLARRLSAVDRTIEVSKPATSGLSALNPNDFVLLINLGPFLLPYLPIISDSILKAIGKEIFKRIAKAMVDWFFETVKVDAETAKRPQPAEKDFAIAVGEVEVTFDARLSARQRDKLVNAIAKAIPLIIDQSRKSV